MTAISQKVPNLWQGISQQPDSKKFPGQARDLVNGFPNFALGLQKRPGGKVLCQLPGAHLGEDRKPDGAWHEILRDETERYIIQVFHDNIDDKLYPNVNVWLLDDGVPRYVDRHEFFGSPAYADAAEHVIDFTISGNCTSGDYTVKIGPFSYTFSYTEGSPPSPSHFITALKTQFGSTQNTNNYFWVDAHSTSTGADAFSIRYFGGFDADEVSITADEETVANPPTFTSATAVTSTDDLSDTQIKNLMVQLDSSGNVTGGLQKDLLDQIAVVNNAFDDFNQKQQAWAIKKKQYDEDSFEVFFKVQTDYDFGTMNQVVIDGVVESADSSQYYKNQTLITDTTNYLKGTEKTDEYPWFRNFGLKVYDLVERTPKLSTVDASGNTIVDPLETAFIAARDAWVAAGNTYTAIRDLYNGAIERTNYSQVGSTYLDGVDFNNVKFLTDADATYILRTDKVVAWDETSKTPKLDNSALVSVNVVDSSANYDLFLKMPDENLGVEYKITPSTKTSLSSITLGWATGTSWSLNSGKVKYIEFVKSTSPSSVSSSFTFNGSTVVNFNSLDADSATHATRLAEAINSEVDDTFAVVGNVDANANKEYVLVYDSKNASFALTSSNTTDFTVGDVYLAKSAAPTTADSSVSIQYRKANASGHIITEHTFFARRNNNVMLLKYGAETTAPEDTYTATIYTTAAANNITIIQHETANIGNLPIYAQQDYKVKVYNTLDVDIDDIWLKFDVEAEGETFGLGNWVESVAPEVYTKIDPKTMPHVLFRNADGTFSLKTVNWDDRVVGDDITNEAPSFIGNSISDIFFYRNRFGVLAGNNVVLTRAGDFENFWNKSAMVAADDDPIDVQAASTGPVKLEYVTPASVGLVVFGTTEQFLLSTDSDLLSPRTAKLNSLSKFSIRGDLEAQTLGSSVAFFSSTNQYLKSFEMLNIANNTAPQLIEHTIQVPKLLPENLDEVTSSPANSMLTFGKRNDKTIYSHKFYRTQDQQVAASWFKWTLSRPLVHQFYDNNTYCTVEYNVDGSPTPTRTACYYLQYEIDEADLTGTLQTKEGVKFDPFLDFYVVNPLRDVFEYTHDPNSTTQLYAGVSGGGFWIYPPVYEFEAEEADDGKTYTRVFLPINFQEDVALRDFKFYLINTDSNGDTIDFEEVTPDGIYLGYYADPLAYNPTGYYNNYHTAVFEGDNTDRKMIVGIPYKFELSMPTIYRVDSDGKRSEADTVKNLIIHRTKFEVGPSGSLTYDLDIDGRDLWSNTIHSSTTQEYDLNTLPVKLDAEHVLPVYQRNKNTNITVSDTSPFPATLVSMTWEGRYTDNHYR